MKMLKILIACEESQAVCKAFRNLGHMAYSCDIQECSGGHPEWHIVGDAIYLIHQPGWDAVIAFPPCTHLSSAGAPSWKAKQADGRQQEGIDFFMEFAKIKVPYCIENPTGIMSKVFRKPDQIINPFQFGEPFRKRTCLWLSGLPLLVPTNIVEPTHSWTSNSTRGGKKKDGTRTPNPLPSFNSWESGKIRSKSFTGIAEAMAVQWSNHLLKI